MDIPEGTEGKRNREHIRQIISEIFPYLCKELDPQIQETNRMPNQINAKGPSKAHYMQTVESIKDTSTKPKTDRIKGGK